MNTLAIGMPGGPELLVILFIVLLLFGAKKLPELSRSMGKSLGEFKKGKEDLEREIREVEEDIKKSTEINEEPAAPKSEAKKEDAEQPKADS